MNTPERQADTAEVASTPAVPSLVGRPVLLLLTGFWAYVTLANILYALSMQTTLLEVGTVNVFASWRARLVQHLILYPALIGCLWIARAIRWRPLWRAIPLQLGCGLLFALCAPPVLVLGQILVGEHDWTRWHSRQPHATALASGIFDGPSLPIWIAGTTSFLLPYAFSLALLTGFEYYRRYRDVQLRSSALERSVVAAQLAALRMQLSPHTLFNLLNTIRGQIGWDPIAAQGTVVRLADILRRLLRAGERETVPLAEEMAFSRLYLELQQQRYPDRILIEAPDPISLPLVWVPSLILQPLVENAVVHGLTGHDGPLQIALAAAASDGILTVSVKNSLSGGRPARPPGVGLRNVSERLRLQFGSRAALSAGFDESGRWVAQIRLPILSLVPEPTNATEVATP